MYKPRKVIVKVLNSGRETFKGKLSIDIPYHQEQVFDIEIPPDKEIEIETQFDEYLIPAREYTVTAKVTDTEVYDEKSTIATKKDSIKFVDVFFNKLPNYMKRLDDWYYWRKGSNWLMYYKYGSNVWIDNNSGYYVQVKYVRHGAGQYLEVYPFEFYVFLEAGFNYELEVNVIEQASFCYEGRYSCVSWPNTYSPSLGFANLCGPLDQIWDYAYHDKSCPEVGIHLDNQKVYNTIMTAAYKGRYGYISDTFAIDTFTLVLEQKDEDTYTWTIKDFKRSAGRSGRTVLATVDYRKDSGEFELGGVLGEDVLGRELDIRNAIPLKIEAYCRTGRASDVSYSSWPYCKTEVYIKVKKVY